MLLQSKSESDDDREFSPPTCRLELKRQVTRMMDGLGLARVELETDVRPAKERARMALKHVKFGLGEP